MPKKIDWKVIRDAFISSEQDLTYSDVASMFGVSRQGVESKASPKAQNWQALREAFRLTNASSSTVEARVAEPDQAEPSSIVVAHHDPEESSFSAQEREPQRIDIDEILVNAISQSSRALQDLEPRSFEKTATVLISLMKTYSERNPPTLAELVDQTIDRCISLGYSSEDFRQELMRRIK
ncbi:MAG: hypothetical protein M3O33_19700 [Cyanobacteriota bacterium]|nr:hypothetical protein [Cyanobacteriota bacterium]